MKSVDLINRLFSFLPNNQKYYLANRFNNIPNRLIYGATFKTEYEKIEQSEKLSFDEIQTIQFNKLKTVINNAYNYTKYYNKSFELNNISPEIIKSPEDIDKIPTTEKSIIRNNIDELKPNNKRYYLHSNTGGTASSPFFFPESLSSKIKERAYLARFYNWHGISEYDSKISLKSAYFSSGSNCYYNPFLKSIVFPVSEISQGRMLDISHTVNCIKPLAISNSYPSLAYIYARYINNGFIDNPRSIKKIFCSSETLFAYQTKEIEKAFGCKPVDHYGQNERVSLIQQCKDYQYHIIPEYGFTEIVDENGCKLVNEGEIGEIVGTSFINDAFPLIRYRTGDYAVVGPKGVCTCGLPYQRIQSIEGRHGDFLKLKNGTTISPTSLEFVTDKVENINDIQLIQKDYDTVEILLVPSERFDKNNEHLIVDQLSIATNYSLNFNLTLVDNIKRPRNMKKRFVISNI